MWQAVQPCHLLLALTLGKLFNVCVLQLPSLWKKKVHLISPICNTVKCFVLPDGASNSTCLKWDATYFPPYSLRVSCSVCGLVVLGLTPAWHVGIIFDFLPHVYLVHHQVLLYHILNISGLGHFLSTSPVHAPVHCLWPQLVPASVAISYTWLFTLNLIKIKLK